MTKTDQFFAVYRFYAIRNSDLLNFLIYFVWFLRYN